MGRPSKTTADSHLTSRETIFVAEYLVDLSPERAALAAGYAPSVARTDAYRWVGNDRAKPHVHAAVGQAIAVRNAATGVAAERVVLELIKIAFASVRRLIRIDEDGVPTIDLSQASDDDLDALLLIQSTTVKEGSRGVRWPVRRMRIRLHSKLAALKMLGEHTGAFKDHSVRQPDSLAKAFAEIGKLGSNAPVVSCAEVAELDRRRA